MFLKYYAELLKKVDETLNDFMTEQVKLVENNPFLHYFIERIRNYLFSGGKRFRPILMILSHASINPTITKSGIIQASLSIELLHNASLIHDDIMDNALTRRGKKAFHYELRDYAKEKHFRNNVNFDNYGLGMGLLGGDYVYNLAHKSIHTEDFSSRITLKAIKVFNECFLRVVQGVIFETDLMGRFEVSEEDYFEMITGKTAAMFEKAAAMGGIFASGSESQITNLSSYGKNSGIAFQLMDDIIGTFGDSKKTGKPTDSDLKEGKKTLLVIKAIQEATDSQRNKLKEILGKLDATKEDIEEARDIIRETGSLAYTREKAEEFYMKSEQLLDEAVPEFDSKYKEYLIEIAKMGVYREK